MKRFLMVLAIALMNSSAFAQDIVVESALTDFKSGNLDAAKEGIDRAMNYPGTKEKPKALYAKGKIYMQLWFEKEKYPKYAATSPYREAAQALMKLAEIKPEYEKADVDDRLKNCAIFYYNDGVAAINKKKTEEGIECMNNVVRIHDLNGGKRYAKYTEDKFPVKKFDTISANANSTIALTYFIDTQYAKAESYLVAAIANPITRTASMYNTLIEVYIKLNKDKELKETRAKFNK